MRVSVRLYIARRLLTPLAAAVVASGSVGVAVDSACAQQQQLRLRATQRAATLNSQATRPLEFVDAAAVSVATRLIDVWRQASGQPRDIARGELFEMLASPSFTVRRSAVHALSRSPVGASTLLTMVSDDMSVAARDGLLSAAFRRFMREPRGGIGIRSGGGLGEMPGIVVASTTPGFPAHEQRLLRPGDRLIEMEGRDLSRGAAGIGVLRPVVFSFDPGQSVTFTIERPERRVGAANNREWWANPNLPVQRLEVDVPLGNLDNLNTLVRPSELREAWRIRLERLGIARADRVVKPSASPSSGERRTSTRTTRLDRLETLAVANGALDERGNDWRDPAQMQAVRVRSARANAMRGGEVEEPGRVRIAWTDQLGRARVDERVGVGVEAAVRSLTLAADRASEAPRPDAAELGASRTVAERLADEARERLARTRDAVLNAIEGVRAVSGLRSDSPHSEG